MQDGRQWTQLFESKIGNEAHVSAANVQKNDTVPVHANLVHIPYFRSQGHNLLQCPINRCQKQQTRVLSVCYHDSIFACEKSNPVRRVIVPTHLSHNLPTLTGDGFDASGLRLSEHKEVAAWNEAHGVNPTCSGLYQSLHNKIGV